MTTPPADNSPALSAPGDDAPGLPRLWAERRAKGPLIISTPHRRDAWFIDAMEGVIGATFALGTALAGTIQAGQEAERSMARAGTMFRATDGRMIVPLTGGEVGIIGPDGIEILAASPNEGAED